MRNFKFRIWSEYQGGKMISPNEIGFYQKAYLHENGSWQTSSLHTLFKRDDVKVMQSTGLKDKNGKDIYEGDIVKGKNYFDSMLNAWNHEKRMEENLYLIKYHEASFKLFDKDNNWLSVLNHHISSKADDLEIVGNIFENKELLFEEEL